MTKSNGISRTSMAMRAIVALAASTSAFGLFALEPGRPDPRMRTFVPPARVVWTSGDAVYGNRSVVKDAKDMFREVLGKNGHDGVSTFYGYYMLEAMSAAGEDGRALDTVRDYWGGMLDMGATSFWEDFNLSWTNNATRLDEMPVQGKKDIHGDFGEFCYRGFRHSLCHGWSAGPAAWCIAHVLGLEAMDVGGRTVRVKPFLGDLEWAEGALPTAQGVVRVRHEKRPDGSICTKIDAPPGVKIIDGTKLD